MPGFQVDLNGQAALVTGAGAGIGRAAALAFARAGASVIVNDLNPDRAERVAQEAYQLVNQTVGLSPLSDSGSGAPSAPKFIGIHADVANRFQAAALIEQARDAVGRIHILVNAAGVYKTGSLATLDEWDWRRVLDVNLTGAFFCTQLLGRVMADEGGGSIVNVAATAGHTLALPDGVSYTASKAGLIGLTKQAAREYALLGIRVNAVCPANIQDDDTPLADLSRIPQGRPGMADEVAAVVLFLCSDAASYMTGQALHVDGGESMV